MSILNSAFNIATLLLIFIITCMILNKRRYYLISIVLTKFLPYYGLLFLFTLNIQNTLTVIFYLSYKFIKYSLQRNKIPQLNDKNTQKYLNDFLIDSKRYIDINVITKPKLRKNKNYIFLYSPHAIYNQGFIYLFGLNDTKTFIDKEKYRRIIPLVDPMFNSVPFISELFSNFGFMGCGKEQINMLLKSGNSIALTVGGIQELFKTEPQSESIYIKNRNSIFDISLTKNVEIVPVFASGESDWYEPFFKYEGLPNKYLSIITYLFSWGKLCKPWMPKKNKLSIIFGCPISINKHSTSKKIKKEYIEQIKFLHETLNEYNKENRQLKIY